MAAIKRLEAGEAVLPLACEPGVSRKLLHDRRKAWGPMWGALQDCHRSAGNAKRRSRRFAKRLASHTTAGPWAISAARAWMTRNRTVRSGLSFASLAE